MSTTTGQTTRSLSRPPEAGRVPKRHARTIVVVLIGLVAAAAWYRTRIPGFRRHLSADTPESFQMTSYFLSAAVGAPASRVGFFRASQVAAFEAAGGMIPASRLDMRNVPGGADPPQALTRVDAGVAWVFHLASLFGFSLSIASICLFQLLADLISLVLTAFLGFRLHSLLAGALAALLYAANTQIPTTALLVAYYFWSVPLALVITHLTLSFWRREWHYFGGTSLLALSFAAVWLRALWLPPLVLVFVGVWLLRGAFKWFTIGLCVLLASYASLILRVRHQNLGDMLHTRSQLWHTLYIGLGTYGDWGQIQWLDEYAYGVAAAAGVLQSDPVSYERLFRDLFLHEVSHHPFRYCLLLVRRAGDYFDTPRASTLGLGRIGRRSIIGWLSILLVVALFRAVQARGWEPLMVYCSGVATWCVFLPPIPIYTTETLGVWPVIVAVFLVEGVQCAIGHRLVREAWKSGGGPSQ